MKAALVALVLVAVASAQQVVVSSDHQIQPSSGLRAQIGTQNHLRGSTAFINKNSVMADNNIAISKSNLLFTANDRLALASKLEEMVTKATPQDVETGVLSHNILTAVSRGNGADAVTMDRASAVVAAKGHPTQLMQSINDLLDTTLKQPQEAQIRETSVIATKDILRQPSGVVNKNAVVSDSNMALQHDTVVPSQNDQILLTDGARVADTIATGSVVRTEQLELFGRKKKKTKKHGGH